MGDAMNNKYLFHHMRFGRLPSRQCPECHASALSPVLYLFLSAKQSALQISVVCVKSEMSRMCEEVE
jgi:hypothetical protein